MSAAENPAMLRAWDVVLSGRQVSEQATRLANLMRRLLKTGIDGAAPAPVAVIGRNSGKALIAFVSTVLSGNVLVPVSSHATAAELAYLLREGGIELVLAGPADLERVLEAVAQVPARPAVWTWEPAAASDRYEDLESLLAAGDDLDADLGGVRISSPKLFSSGTTGRPKSALLPPRVFPENVTVAQFTQWAGRLRFAPHGTHLLAGPMYHSGPIQAAWLLAAGVPVIVPRKFDPQAILDLIEAEQVATTLMVPTHFVRLLAYRDQAARTYDVSSITHVTQAGAGCPIDVKQKMIDWWGPVFLETYGATEAGSLCTITSQDWLRHQGSVGQAVPGLQAVAVDESGNELPRGQFGKLYFIDETGRGIRYENQPEQTAAAHLRPGVFTLGESGYVDAEGYVFITDRDSDKVVSGGVNLYPAETERVLLGHPAVADCAVIGADNAEMGEELRALVVRQPGATAGSGELIEFCRDNLSHLKSPRSVVFVDSVERSPMGKLSRRALRQRYGGAQAPQRASSPGQAAS